MADEWIRLTSGKEFSRLLYSNPVCFLYVEKEERKKHEDTRKEEENLNKEDTTTTTTTTDNNNKDEKTHDVSPSTGRRQFENDGDISSSPLLLPSNRPPIPVDKKDTAIRTRRNVQVLSWLTATNNEGGFLCSLNQRRYTTSFFVPQQEQLPQAPQNQVRNNNEESCNQHATPPLRYVQRFFSLSVPVHGMELLVLAVGSTSGRFGSKFPIDHNNDDDDDDDDLNHAKPSVDQTKGGKDEEEPEPKTQQQQEQNTMGAPDNQDNFMELTLPPVVRIPNPYKRHHPQQTHHCSSPKLQEQQQEERQATSQAGRHRRQRGKNNKDQYSKGIPGLDVIWFPLSNTTTNYNNGTDDTLRRATQFAGIKGCVAHLFCRVIQLQVDPPPPPPPPAATTAGTDAAVDNNISSPVPAQPQHQRPQEHVLIWAQVEAAFVHTNYWDGQKKLFRPQQEQQHAVIVPPYLTFFGSQTFGYVHTAPSIPQNTSSNHHGS